MFIVSAQPPAAAPRMGVVMMPVMPLEPHSKFQYSDEPTKRSKGSEANQSGITGSRMCDGRALS